MIYNYEYETRVHLAISMGEEAILEGCDFDSNKHHMF